MSGEDYMRKLWSLCMSRGNLTELADIIIEKSEKSPRYTDACISRVKTIMERKLKALSREPRDRSEVNKIFRKLNEVCIDSVLQTLSRVSSDHGKSRGRGRERRPERRRDEFMAADAGYTDCASVDDNCNITDKIDPVSVGRKYDYYNNPHNRNMIFRGGQKPPSPDFTLDGSGEEVRRRKALARQQEEAMARGGYGPGGFGPGGYEQMNYGFEPSGYDQGGSFGGPPNQSGLDSDPYRYLLGGGAPPSAQHYSEPPGYGQQLPSYGQQLPSYGQSMPDYGQPMPNYGQTMTNYGQPMPNFRDDYRGNTKLSNQKSMALTTDFNRMMAERENDNLRLGIPSSQVNYGSNQGGYDQNGYEQGYNQNRYEQDYGGYDQGYGNQGYGNQGYGNQNYTYNPNI
jgi:hypothetical protein